MIFNIIPLVGLDMDAEQIKAEFKVARIKLNEAVKNWVDPNKQKFQKCYNNLKERANLNNGVNSAGKEFLKEHILPYMKKELGLDD